MNVNFSIGELSRRTGCKVETIRYYERIGLLPEPPRRGRYRQYTTDDTRRLGFLRRARTLGFTLDEIRALFRLAAGGNDSCIIAREIASLHLSGVKARIADLVQMESVLTELILACDLGETSGCPMLETLTENVEGANPTNLLSSPTH